MKDLINFVALDIETTGFDFIDNEIIEIGAVRYKGSEETERFSVFIKPKKPVPQFIKQLTHISDEQLATGENLEDALARLLEFLGTDIVVCHNVYFDIGFLNAKYEKLGFPKLSNQTIDTLTLARIYLPFIQNHKLGTVAEYFNIDLSNSHRAIFDAKATAGILVELLQFIDENIPLSINHRLLDIAVSLRSMLGLVYLLEKIVNEQKKTALLSKKQSKIDFHNRNYIENKPEKIADVSIDDVFGNNGLFAKHFDKYESRQGQIDMADAILQKYMLSEFLLVEAGTGVGKSLAYLIPSIIFSNQNDNKKIIISTNTKNLQEQLFYKDLPAVSKSVNLPFKATLLKGRRNYLCTKKWLEVSMDMERMLSYSEMRSFMNLLVWKEFTQTGDISENTSFDPNREASLWKKISADSFVCRKRRCPHFKQCFLMNIRSKAEESNLVIINHHLLLADMTSEFAALGEYEYLIIDEAHNLPQLAQVELGTAISFPEVSNFFSSLFVARKKFQHGVLVSLKTAAVKSNFGRKSDFIEQIDKTIQLIDDNKELFEKFFMEIRQTVEKKGSYGKLRIKDSDDHPFLSDYLSKIINFWAELSRSFLPIFEILSKVSKQRFIDHSQNMEILESIQQRIADYHILLSTYFNPNLKDFAYWMEVFPTSDLKYPSGFLCYCPLDVSTIFQAKLFESMRSIIFTSATIAIRDKFKYFSNRMGLDLLEEGFVQELVVQSPFDYKKQSLVLVAGFLPDPKDRFFSSQCLDIIRRSIEVSKAGTMVLFTAYKNLNEAYEELSDEFSANDILLMAQGKGMSRSAMLKEFRKHRSSVLLGTNSFWEGVDVPGESLELLILQKLPFMVPSEPIVEAYLEKLQAEGKDSFMHFMLPNSLLKYRQGFGRLIRHKTDRGVVLVLDNRIMTKRYGQFFKDTVPANTHIAMNDLEVYDYLTKWFKKI
ncbi:MAG: DEAD/DEAH box helicase [Candidatus Cloacimonetes bacterium]|nr:DEAD/DEAH box helicase [Candidatus Cloacimonadota bacterium]MCF7815005.1 DEAD/DEAH box helicase [Candidatus Cloacimonadota bacterium]MCF7869248.1 DEAD/DEAH box helicase [Candidatus Cloacimonadota bacterium]MCF7884682.1 DEAD/DEAH box helicase [Candidatus Cloacimonadota bacterium]